MLVLRRRENQWIDFYIDGQRVLSISPSDLSISGEVRIACDPAPHVKVLRREVKIDERNDNDRK